MLSLATIEERINEVLQHKRELFAQIIGENSAPASLRLSQSEIFACSTCAHPREQLSRQHRPFGLALAKTGAILLNAIDDCRLMPKLYEYFGIVVLFNSNEHEPVHVHGRRQGRDSKAELIIENGRVIRIN